MKNMPQESFGTAMPSRPLLVAMVSETYPPEVNGVAHTARRMAQGLISRYHQVQLIRPRQHAEEQGKHSSSFEEVLVRGMPMPRYAGLRVGFPAASDLLRLWRARRPHIVLVVTEGPLGWAAMNVAKKLKLPVISEFHTNFHAYSQYYGMSWLGGAIRGYLRWFHGRALTTLVPTESLRRELTGVGFRRMQVLARGVDTALFNPARRSRVLRLSWGADDNGTVMLYVGRIAAEKNLSLLIDAYRRAQAIRRDLRLVMVGDGPARAALQGDNPDVIFVGMKTGEALAEHYASADLFLFPSTTETFGNVVIEAMASGLPVLAYDYAAAREHIRHGENGMLAAFDDPEAFIRLTACLTGDTSHARNMGQQARASAEGIAWELIHERYERLITTSVNQWEESENNKRSLSFVPDL
jgi:glycosyltransferase involved in cell wall biosynthesis